MNYCIKNGMAYDSAAGKWEKRDICIKDGLLSDREGENSRIIDAFGCIIAPGLIDYHVHYFKGGADNGVSPDTASFPSGITTAVDGGTCGVSSWEAFERLMARPAAVRLLSQLHVASGGQLTESYMENLSPALFDRKRITELFRRYPSRLVGLKTRISANIIEPSQARDSLEEAVKLADEIGCSLTVHITNPAMDLEEMAAILRPGDVMCHIFQNKGKESILDGKGNVRPGIRKARERGVLFDACNGRNNFDLNVARAAIEQGFLPDIISSDINTNSCYEGILHSLPRVLSKYSTFGLSLEQILDAAIKVPARLIGREALASLDPGTEADLFIFKVEERKITYLDHTGGINRMEGNQMIVPQMTIKGGQVVYSQVYFG